MCDHSYSCKCTAVAPAKPSQYKFVRAKLRACSCGSFCSNMCYASCKYSPVDTGVPTLLYPSSKPKTKRCSCGKLTSNLCLACDTVTCVGCPHKCVTPPEFVCQFCSGEIEEKPLKTWCGHHAHVLCAKQMEKIGGCCPYPPSKTSWLFTRSVINDMPPPVHLLVEDEHYWVLALLYKHGIRVAKNETVANKYMALALEQGQHDALVEQAMVSTTGAADLLRRAALWTPNNGNANVALYHRTDVPDDERRAALEAAVASKHPGALYLKSQAILLQGKPLEDALSFLLHAADQGYFLAIEALIEYYRLRDDLPTALMYAQRRIGVKHPLTGSCCVSLGLIYEKRKMKNHAIEYYTLGSQSKEDHLGGIQECLLYLEDLVPKKRPIQPMTALKLVSKHLADGVDLDHSRVRRFIKHAAPLDMVGEFYLSTGIALQDMALLQEAADRGQISAYRFMANIQLLTDLAAARAYFMKALPGDVNGDIYLDAGKSLMDETLLREAGVRGQPEGYYHLGHILFTQQKVDEARRAFLQSLKPGKAEFDRSKSAKALIQLFS